MAEVWHGDLWGKRETKYSHLESGRIGKPITEPIDCSAPQYAFVRRNHALIEIYGQGFGLAKFMPENVTGIVTAKDGLVIHFTGQGLEDRISRFADPGKNDDQIRAEFFPNKKAGKYPSGDSMGWKLPAARAALQRADWSADITSIAYRPFDSRAILYCPDMVDWGRFEFMRQMLSSKNVALMVCRQSAVPSWEHALVTDCVVDDSYVSNRTKERGYCLPLYLYPDEQDLDQSRRINFDPKLYAKLQKLAKHPDHGPPDELAVLDYIYGVPHCPAYRETYAEFLKTDFPRIPWPKTSDEFWDVSAKGHTLRQLHLMDPATIGPTPFPFIGDGDNVVDKPRFEGGKVWINVTQCFDAAPDVSWTFYIGGYQPAQKWLKDRKGRALTFDDVKHYQRILKILSETDRIMQTITMDLTT